ncbi:hypothetical protein RND81_03G053300 [Saponaria officinalis]|uniref:Reverse transcriptase n=1 Tax=Saponaria officinalis TaxID=3572 RepID=A0AAW1M5Q9_SAPOF
MGLLETRVKEANVSRVLNKFARFRALNNYSAHYNGRIRVLWQEALLNVTVLLVTAQMVDLKVFCRLLNTSVYITIVYGFNDGVSRKVLWTDLIGLVPSVDLGWLVLEDFNIVRTMDDKIGRHPLVKWEMLDFNSCLNWCSLDELYFQGGPFTWTNNQDGDARGWSRLDWAFFNPLWLRAFLDSIMRILPSRTSDHSPLLVLLGVQAAFKKSFKFLNCWIANARFLELVASAWDSVVFGTPIYRLFSKLKKAELSMLAQKAKITHLKLSDSNTAYFYSAVAARRHLSVVGSIVDHHGQVCSSPDVVAAAFCGYYQSLLGTTSPVAPLSLTTIQSCYCLNASEADSLSVPISPTEIRAALFSMGSNKSPGIDGFSVKFFKASWSIVSSDFCGVVNDYFRHGRLLRYASTTVNSLIPKKASACSVLDYRPISC